MRGNRPEIKKITGSYESRVLEVASSSCYWVPAVNQQCNRMKTERMDSRTSTFTDFK